MKTFLTGNWGKIVLCLFFNWLSLSVQSAGWNTLWRDDFGVAEDSVIKNFADKSQTVPGHKFDECHTIDDGWYGITNNTYWSFRRKKSCRIRPVDNFINGRDHTGNNNGGMLIVNVGTKGKGECVYERDLELDVCENHKYRLSFYLASVRNSPLKPKLGMEIVNIKDPENPVTILKSDPEDSHYVTWTKWTNTINEPREWGYNELEFSAQSGDKIKLKINNFQSTGNGNDFAIDDITLERYDEDEVDSPFVDGEVTMIKDAISNECTQHFNIKVSNNVIDSWKKVYNSNYFLWQVSTDDGYTWENLPELSGIDKTSITKAVNESGKEVFRLILVGDNSPQEAEDEALYISEHQKTTQACKIFSISNIAGPTPIEKTPTAQVGINESPTNVSSVLFNCNEEYNSYYAKLDASKWEKAFGTDFSFVWEYSFDGSSWTIVDQTEPSLYYDPDWEEKTYVRAILAKTKENALYIAQNGEPLTCDPYYITNYVTFNCYGCTGEALFSSQKNEQFVCPNALPTAVSWSAQSIKGNNIINMTWQQTSYGQDDWKDIENEEEKTLSIPTPNESTTYRFIGKEKGCWDTLTFQLKVEEPIELNPVTDVVVCSGDSVQLTASIKTGNADIYWNNDPVSASSKIIYNINEGETVSVYAKNERCQSEVSNINISVEKKIVIDKIEDIPAIVCKGNSVQLSAQVQNLSDAHTFQWTKGTDLLSDSELNITDVPTGPTTYQLTIKGEVCPDTVATLGTTVEEPTQLAISLSKSKICEGDSISITPAVTPSSVSYKWMKKEEGETNFSEMDSRLASNYVGKATTQFYISSFGEKACSSVSSNIDTLLVENTMSITMEVSSSDICEGEDVTLSTQFAYEAGIIWESKSASETNFSIVSTGTSQEALSPQENTTYRVSAESELGCKVQPVEKTVKVIQKQEFDLADIHICENSSAHLSLPSHVKYDRLEWRDVTEDSIIGRQASVTVMPSEDTQYSVTLFNQQCSTEKWVHVYTEPAPLITDYEKIGKGTYRMITDPYEGNIYFKYGKAAERTSSDILDSAVMGRSYNIEVSNELGCSSSIVLDIPYIAVSIPEYFFPERENWVIANLNEYEQTILRIYDRAGKQLFEIRGKTDGWNGKYKGRDLPSTDYWYNLYIGELDREYVGHFTLLRISQ